MKIRKNTLLIMMILLTVTFMFANTKNVSAKVTFNKTSKSITKGKSYTIKISGVKSKNIKKVKLKYNKKIIKVKKLRKNKYRITGKKKGKTTLKATVKYLLLDYTPAVKTIKCKINVKNKAAKKKKTNNKKNNDSEENIKPEIDWGENNIDKLIAQIEQSKTYKGTLYKLNDYTVFNKGEDGGEDQYGLITSPFYSTIDWYSKKDYDKIMNEVKRIVKESKITDDMIDEEKAYRIGRYMVKHIDYDYSVYGQRIYETLFDKKTVCAGYSVTYALICRYIGIDCDFVYTTDLYVDGQNMNHAWNYIKLGDYYYVVDLTKASAWRNSYSIVTGFFYQYDSLIEEYRKNVQSNYKTNDYIKTHKVDTINHYMRCKKNGDMSQTLTDSELYNLPE